MALDHDRHIKTSPIGSTSIPLKDVKTLSSSTAASTAPIKMTNFLTAKKQVSSHLGWWEETMQNFFLSPTPTLMTFTWVHQYTWTPTPAISMNVSILQSDNQKEVTRFKVRFKPTSPDKSGVDGGANQVPTYLGKLLHLYSQRLYSIAIIASMWGRPYDAASCLCWTFVCSQDVLNFVYPIRNSIGTYILTYL